MQVSVESNGTLKRSVKVSIPEDRIAGEVQNRLKSLSQKSRIDGFRQGKAPFKVVEKRYGKQVRQEVIGDVVQSSLYEALQQEKLVPAGRPYIDPLEAEPGNGLSYTASFEIMPTVKVNDVSALAVERTTCQISDEDYQKMVAMLRQQRQDWQEVDRPAAEGDTVEIDFEGFIDDQVFEGGSASGFRLELGQNRFIEGFEAGLTGSSAGETQTLNLVFPEAYQNAELAGKPVRFEVTVHKVLGAVLPELDEEFFKAFGVSEGGEEAFREEVLAHMNREAEAAIRVRLRENVMNALFEANPTELPHALVHEEAHRLYHDFHDRLKAYGINQETPRNHEDENLGPFESQATRRVTLQMLMMEIIREQDLKADPAKVREIIEKNAASYEDPAAVLNWYYQDRQRLAEVEAAVLEDAVVDWICGQAKVSEVAVKFDELMNKRQTA